jgi:hypothetical protein
MFVFFVVRRRNAAYREFLREQALKRNGKLIGGFFGSPKLLFNHKRNNIVIDSSLGTGGRRVSFTRARSSFTLTLDGKLTVGTEPPGAKLSKWLGMQDIQIGNTEFDDAFLIKANEESFARTFLTPEVQQKLLGLGNLYLQVRQGELILYIWYVLQDSTRFNNFIDTVIFLFDNTKRLRQKV